MRAKTNTSTFALGIFSIAMLSAVTGMSYSSAESLDTISLNDDLALEKTVITMSVPKGNTLPWGTVEGSVDDPAKGYPVIIQFFKDGDPVHVAQVDVKENDTYEYKFRVRDVDLETGKATNIFEGEYTVKIFKVVNSHNEDLDTV